MLQSILFFGAQMKKEYFKELFNCFIFAVINGMGQCLGHWAGTYIIEYHSKKGQKRIGF